MDNVESTLGVDSRQHTVDTVDFTELLDLAKQASGATSDSDLSRKLGVSRQSVSNWRNSNKFPDTITCATIAGITGVPLAKVLGIVGEARATDQEEKAVWRKLAATAMALLVGVGFAYFQGDAGAALAAMVPLAVIDPLYIMRNGVMHRLSWIWLWITSHLPSRPPKDQGEIEA